MAGDQRCRPSPAGAAPAVGRPDQAPAPGGTGAELLGRFPPRPVAAWWPATRTARQQVLGRAPAGRTGGWPAEPKPCRTGGTWPGPGGKAVWEAAEAALLTSALACWC